MKKILVALVVFALPQLTWAQLVTFSAQLTGSQETPPVMTPASGWAMATLDLGTRTFDLDYTFAGLVATQTAAHIHTAPMGVAGPVTLPLPLGSPSGLVAVLTQAQVNDLMAGLWYVNVHSTVFPAGEIRGQLLPVPEPSTYALGGALLLGVLVFHQRRKRRQCLPSSV